MPPPDWVVKNRWTRTPRPIAVEAVIEAPLVDPATGEDLGIPLVGIVDLVVDAPGGPVILAVSRHSSIIPTGI